MRHECIHMTGSGCGNPLSKSATDIAHYNLPPRLGGDVLWLLPNLPGLALSSFSADTRSAAEGNTMLCSVGCVCGIRSEDTPSSFKNDSRPFVELFRICHYAGYKLQMKLWNSMYGHYSIHILNCQVMHIYIGIQNTLHSVLPT